MKLIPYARCEDRRAYRVVSRNLEFAVFRRGP